MLSTSRLKLNLSFMKNISILALLLLMIFPFQKVFSQINISCSYREICTWNSFSESFDECYGYEENSLFKINESETMFTHVTESIKSAYYIDSKSQDEETGVWMLSVQSDVGNDYIYFLDFEHDEIRVAINSDEGIKMVRFYVKRIWQD